MEENPRLLWILIMVVILIIVGAGFWYWYRSRQAPKEVPTLGSQLFEKTQNPLKGQVPEINPFKEQKNPFDTIYKNPFE